MTSSRLGAPPKIRRPLRRPALSLLTLSAAALVAVAGPAVAGASAGPSNVSVKTVRVSSPGNPSAAITPFTDAIYQTCADDPQTSPPCEEIGAVDYRYGIGELEITVKQWVKFLNTVDPEGTDENDLYDPSESSSSWPKYGQINETAKAPSGEHYSVAYPEWEHKPYGFADFLRAARFVNSLTNGPLLSKEETSAGGFDYVSYRVQLSRVDGHGMYDLSRDKRTGATRAQANGFVVPSEDEWVKSAYYDPAGGGTYSYWKYPTNAGVFGDDTLTAPSQATLDPATGDVTNSATQPLAIYHGSDPAPSWCPAAIQPQSDCSTVNPFGIGPTAYADAYQGSLGTVGQAETTSPWGTLDQGGNAVEWTDTITAPPSGNNHPGRVWRRLHGGVPNAPAYQLWLSAVGLQPQDNKAYELVYPWLGFRVGVVGNLGFGRDDQVGSTHSG